MLLKGSQYSGYPNLVIGGLVIYDYALSQNVSENNYHITQNN